LHLTDFAIEEVRNIYMNLRPSLLDDLGIVAAMKWFLGEFRKASSGIRIEEEISIEEDQAPEPLKITLFRVLQGAMDNIAKHSRATRATVTLRLIDNQLELLIEDNGLGFDLDGAAPVEILADGIGLAVMQERVESSDGIFIVKSAKGEGTVVRALWDMSKLT
jgi:signal transduction histidine kinase